MLVCSPIAATALIQVLYFFDQTLQLLFFLLDVFVRLLFEGDVFSKKYGSSKEPTGVDVAVSASIYTQH